MERLTYEFCVGSVHCNQVRGADNLECGEVCQRQDDDGCATCPIARAFDRLAVIEDILGDEYDLDRLRELVQADREGRCVVLPVKLGDKVYRIMYRVNEETQKAEKCVDAGTVDFIQSVPDLFVSNGFVYKFTEIGKTVFLSREEAEAALKGENENGMDKR